MGIYLDDPDGVGKLSPDIRVRMQLQHDKVLLNQIDRAILAFTLTNSSVQEYTIDTGQDKQTVKRTDLQNLYAVKRQLLGEIAQLESALSGGGAFRIVPGF